MCHERTIDALLTLLARLRAEEADLTEERDRLVGAARHRLEAAELTLAMLEGSVNQP